jgi:hypothetical protein
VDQEVGGSSPPSCTSKINSLLFAEKAADNVMANYGKHSVSRYSESAPFSGSDERCDARFAKPLRRAGCCTGPDRAPCVLSQVQACRSPALLLELKSVLHRRKNAEHDAGDVKLGRIGHDAAPVSRLRYVLADVIAT